MFWAIFWFGVGLLVGWNFFAQPVFVKDLVDTVKEKISSFFTK